MKLCSICPAQAEMVAIQNQTICREWPQLGHVANPRPVATIKTGRVAQLSQTHSDATGLNCGDRSWICKAPLVLMTSTWTSRLQFCKFAKHRKLFVVIAAARKFVSCDSRHYMYMAKACAYSCQHRLWRHAGVGKFGENS